MSAHRSAARWSGNALILLGVTLALYLAHQLFWANRQSAQAAAQTVRTIEREWREQPVLARPASEPAREPARPGAGLALLRIPRLADQWDSQPVLEGVAAEELDAGVGHYPGTALPGEVGNFAVAGHRLGHGQPFHWLDRLAPGDAVEVLTATTVHRYRVTGSAVVAPSASAVLAAVPGQPDATPTQRWMTLTTCHPRYSSEQRLVYHALLDSSRPR